MLSVGLVLERADGRDDIIDLYTNKNELADNRLHRCSEGLRVPVKLGKRSASGSCGRDAWRGRRPRGCGPSRLKSSRRRHLELAKASCTLAFSALSSTPKRKVTVLSSLRKCASSVSSLAFASDAN